MQRLGIIPNAELPGGLDGDKLKAFAPGLLLSAWITRIMYTEILVNPFWFLDHLLAVLAPAESYSMAAGMHHLFQELENLKAGDCKDVHTCRQDFMAFLDPDDPTLPKSTESRDFSQHVEEALKAATEEVAGKIVETSAVLLKDPGSEKLRTALNYMTLQTAERGYQIAQSRACLRISYINELPPDFKGTEGNMRRHDSHRIYLSEKPEGGYLHVEDETRLIGKPVLLVVEPLITARGYSSKVNYDVEHVMNPAFVWLGEEYTTIE
ncbi:hypothetical protein EJ08DRAFT_282910 [Tothia fuscella]|uniref:Uncharacterized protein n=1 Tax=Tothia fuscella TaxID=1048955 RepID=A0A9P4P2W8_9PEZI|nr:hypothetical protein EJ08DRAFT_282910 [Tothia fuscella]